MGEVFVENHKLPEINFGSERGCKEDEYQNYKLMFDN
jgi:hypothetical protein